MAHRFLAYRGDSSKIESTLHMSLHSWQQAEQRKSCIGQWHETFDERKGAFVFHIFNQSSVALSLGKLTIVARSMTTRSLTHRMVRILNDIF